MILGKQIKFIFIISLLIFLPISIFAIAEVRNVTVTAGCYNPGENITVSFEVRATSAWQNIYGDILFSTDSTAEYNDDCVWNDGGAQDPPDTDGHNGGFFVGQGGDTGDWHEISKIVKVPSSYSGDYYIIVNVAENYMQLFSWGSHIENSANTIISECVQPTPTVTPIDPYVLLDEVQTNFNDIITFKGYKQKEIFYSAKGNTTTYQGYIKIKTPDKYRETGNIGYNTEWSFNGSTYYYKDSTGTVRAYSRYIEPYQETRLGRLENVPVFDIGNIFDNMSLMINSKMGNNIVIRADNSYTGNYCLIHIDNSNKTVNKIEFYYLPGSNKYREVIISNYTEYTGILFPLIIEDRYLFSTESQSVVFEFSVIEINSTIDDSEFIIE